MKNLKLLVSTFTVLIAFSLVFTNVAWAQATDIAKEFDLEEAEVFKDAKGEKEQKSNDDNASKAEDSSDGEMSEESEETIPVQADLDEISEASVEDLKQQMLELNRDLLILEEELLFPASTQVSVFLSMDVGTFFQLDSVRLEIDGKQVATHLYTDRQLDALHRGGVQRLHMGNIKSGVHEITAFFIGDGTHKREYKRAASIDIEKLQDPLMLELVVRDSARKLQPEFEFQTWIL